MNLLSGSQAVATSKNGDARTVPTNADVRALLVDLSLKRRKPDDPDEPIFTLAYRTTARAFDRAVKAAQTTLRAAVERLSAAGGDAASKPAGVELGANLDSAPTPDPATIG